MEKDKRILYSIVYSLLIILSLTIFISINILKYFLTFLLVIYTVLTLVLIKKRSVLSIHKKEVTLIVSIIALVYLMIYYLSGIKFGFYSANNISFEVIFKQMIPLIITIISSELIRYVFLAQKRKSVDIITFICFVLIDFLMVYNVYSFTNINVFMDAIGLVLLPAITFNILYNNLSKNYGYMPNIIFKLITTLYIYFISFAPSTPDSLVALFKLLIPLIILWFIKILYQEKNKVAITMSTKLNYVMYGVTAFIMILIVMMVSNQLPIGSVVIATESMKDDINVGDVILYQKIDDDIISVGQVIIFEKEDSLIVHRVIDIQYIDGVVCYYTKGDANEEPDSGYITKTDIVGYTRFKVPYIGYPTLWLHGLFENEK